MKVVIFAGGFGTRISEETGIRPKPMVEIGGKPILWHIMKTYATYGHTEFVILCGYKAQVIKEYFANYLLNNADVTFDFKENSTTIHKNGAEDWKVTLVDTGEDTMTGGRLKRAQKYIGNETFCLTYGDGVSDIDINKLIAFHKEQKTDATVTVIQPPGRFGVIDLKTGDSKVNLFKEKPASDGGGWISGGYFVLEPSVFDLIQNDTTVWEQEPMQTLAHTGELSAFRHTGFWQPMDTLRDKNELEKLWKTGHAPWKAWAK